MQMCAQKKKSQSEMQTKRSIRVRELREHTTKIVQQVRLNGVAVDITDRGNVIARLIPVRERENTSEETSATWTDLDRLAAEIGARWPAGQSAVDVVREGRREL